MAIERRKIPGSGLEISRLALGGWLTLGGSTPDQEAFRILDRALELGINHVDLADVYGNGEAERVVGRFLREWLGASRRREDVVISSKVFHPTSDDPRDRGLGRAHVTRSIDRTLQRLGLDVLDLYYCHREDPGTPLPEIVETMDALVRAGKIRAWGTSTWHPKTLRAAHRIARRRGLAPPVIEQPCYNLFERWVEESVLRTAKALDMAVIAFSPLATGALTGKYVEARPDECRANSEGFGHKYLEAGPMDQQRAFVALAAKHELAPSALALAWLLGRPGLDAVILGTRTLEQLEENVRAAEIEIGAELEAALDAIFPSAERPLWYRALKRLLGRG